jgi:hypothetical protein
MAQKIPLLYENVFSKSPEVSVSGTKKPTSISCYLWDEGRTTHLEGQTVFVGTKIRIEFALWDRSKNYQALPGKTARLFHRLDTGAWEKIFEGTPNAPELGPSYYKFVYTLPKAGTHAFYTEFVGDDEYEGCEKAVRAFVKCTVC